MRKKRSNIIEMNSYFRKSVRRKKPYSFLLILIVAALGASIFFAYKEKIKSISVLQDLPYGLLENEPLVTGKTLYYEADLQPIPKDDMWVLYQNLGAADQNVYDLFVDLIENREDKDYRSIIIISDAKLNEIGKSYFWNIYYTMCYDHPEYFFLLSDNPRIDCYITKSQGYTIFHYSMKEQNEWENVQVSTFNAATDRFMSDINLDASDEEIELQIHDKLLELVSYNRELFINGTPKDSGWDLGHTAYGALVGDSSGKSNYAVCSGYALAFEHLMHKAGIPCGYISGFAYDETEKNPEECGHAWNIVKIDNKWYEVDVTWDDFDFIEKEVDESFLELLKGDETAFFNTRHHFYNRSTKEMENLAVTDATVFNISGYQPYNPMRNTYHVRGTKIVGATDEGEVFRNLLIPYAE